MYWCDFPTDAQLPEFWKTRPVVIVSLKNALYDAVTVVPCTTAAQLANKWAYQLPISLDGQLTWAVCDKISTFAVSRLSQDKSGIPRVPDKEFNKMLEIMMKGLATPRP